MEWQRSNNTQGFTCAKFPFAWDGHDSKNPFRKSEVAHNVESFGPNGNTATVYALKLGT